MKNSIKKYIPIACEKSNCPENIFWKKGNRRASLARKYTALYLIMDRGYGVAETLKALHLSFSTYYGPNKK